MMRKRVFFFQLIFIIGLISCSEKNTPPPPPPPVVPPDTTTLKQMASYPVGVAINYDLMKGNASYSSLVKKEFDRITFEYQMKHCLLIHISEPTRLLSISYA